MDNLDKFIREKFQEREFEFNEAHWEQAKQMIEDQEQGKRRGFVWWWWIPLLFIGIIGGTFAYSFFTNDDQIAQNDITANNQTSVPSESNAAITETLNKTEVTTQIQKPEDPLPKDTDNQNAINENNKGPASNATNGIKVEKDLDLVKANNSINTLNNNTSRTISKTGSPSSTTEKAKSINSIPQNSIGKNNSNIELAEKENGPKTIGLDDKVTSTLGAKSLAERSENSKDITLESKEKNEFIDLLENLDIFAVAQARKIKGCDAFKEKKRKWFWGVTVESEFYPRNEIDSAIFSKAWTGFAVGFTNRYRISNNLFIGGDVLWRNYQPTFNNSFQTASQVSYGFGARESLQGAKINSINYISVPIYLQLQNGRHLVEAGGSFNRILNFQVEITERQSLFPWERENPENNFSPELMVERGTLPIGDYNSVPNLNHMEFFIGYKNQITPRLQLGLRAKYWLNKPSSEAVGWLEQGAVSAGVSLSYFFQKPKTKYQVIKRN